MNADNRLGLGPSSIPPVQEGDGNPVATPSSPDTQPAITEPPASDTNNPLDLRNLRTSRRGLRRGFEAVGFVALAAVAAVSDRSRATAGPNLSYRQALFNAFSGSKYGGAALAEGTPTPPIPPSPTRVPIETQTPIPTTPKYEASSEVSSIVVNEIKQNVTGVGEFYKSSGLQPVPGITVYISDNPNFLTDAEMRVLNLPESERASRLERWNDPNAVSGAIAEDTFHTGAIFVKVSPEGWTNRAAIFRAKTIGHEYTAVAKEVRAKIHTGSPPDSIGLGGPRWLHTGTNEEGGFEFLKFIDPQGYKDFHSWAAGEVRNHPYPLQQMETSRGFDNAEAAGGNAYPLTLLAVDYLVQTSGGIKSMFRYYELIGQGMVWPDAFKAAFGRDNGTFYTQYANYLATTPPLS